uniref:Uncharacterized protein n=1 Tax=Cercocebus atys TaxID=9531 RepID=A0A2K5LFI7_CERAT
MTLRLSGPHRTAVVHCFNSVSKKKKKKKLITILYIFMPLVFASICKWVWKMCCSWVKLCLMNSKVDIFPTYYHC